MTDLLHRTRLHNLLVRTLVDRIRPRPSSHHLHNLVRAFLPCRPSRPSLLQSARLSTCSSSCSRTRPSSHPTTEADSDKPRRVVAVVIERYKSWIHGPYTNPLLEAGKRPSRWGTPRHRGSSSGSSSRRRMRGWIRKPVSLREKGEDRKEERKKVEVERRPGYTGVRTIIHTKEYHQNS